MRGEPGAATKIVGTMALRGVAISLGLLAVGFRGQQLLLGTVGSLIGIEAGVLIWAWSATQDEQK
jgi:hypothetical protein